MGESVVRGLYPIRVGFGGLCRWLEWEKVPLGAYFPSVWDLVVCVGGLIGMMCRYGLISHQGGIWLSV